MNVVVTSVYSVTREIIARMRERVRVRAREVATYQHLFASFALCGWSVLAGICNRCGVGIVRRRALFPFSIFEGLLKSAYFFGLVGNGID